MQAPGPSAFPNELLCSAARAGALQEMKDALAAGADPNFDEQGHTPLMYACPGDHADCVRLLISRGADPNRASSAGTLPLMVAVFNASGNCVKALLELGARANPGRAGSTGQRNVSLLATAMESVVGNGRAPTMLAIMTALATAGADPNIASARTGMPPLYSVTSVQAATCLLSAGASTAARKDLRLPPPAQWHRQHGAYAIADAIQAVADAHAARTALIRAHASLRPRHRA